MIVKARVEETIVIAKDVEVEIPSGTDEDAIEDAIRSKAFEKIITDKNNGWMIVDSLDVDMSIEPRNT